MLGGPYAMHLPPSFLYFLLALSPSPPTLPPAIRVHLSAAISWPHALAAQTEPVLVRARVKVTVDCIPAFAPGHRVRTEEFRAALERELGVGTSAGTPTRWDGTKRGGEKEVGWCWRART
jgi:hypothetical protein